MFVYTFGKIIDLLAAYRLFFDPNNMSVALPDVVDMAGVSNTFRPFFTCNKTGNTFIEMLLLSQSSNDKFILVIQCKRYSENNYSSFNRNDR